MRIRLFLIFLIFVVGIQQELFSQLDSTNLPLFIIDTKGSSIPDEPKITADLRIIYDGQQYNHPDDQANIYEGKIGIEIRGRYSSTLPQKPFGIETRDALGENLNVPLFHMTEENDWILLANYNDKTFLRNSLAFELFRRMGHYAPRTMYCEVLINGNYRGIYTFTEKIKRDKGRVNIATLNPDENSGDDVTGGYIFKVDYYNESDSWTSSYPPRGYPDKKVHFVYHYPKPEDITADQKWYIRDFIKKVEDALYTANTSERREKLYSVLDINSFIDYFIVGELSRNVDAYKKSAFFYKQKDSQGGKLFAGPVWDFDWAWKNINECYFGATDGSGWAYQVHKCNPWPVPPTWMERLLEDQYFTQKLLARYGNLRQTYLSEDFIFSYIDSTAAVLDEAQDRHYQKWRILGVNVGTPEVDPQPATYAGEISKFKQWISTRLQWLDAHMPGFVITGLEEDALENDHLIYPNPVSTQLTIQAPGIIKNISVFSINGKIRIFEEVNKRTVKIPVQSLSQGIYLVRITEAGGQQWSGKFVKTE
jgi:hypothetical protein